MALHARHGAKPRVTLYEIGGNFPAASCCGPPGQTRLRRAEGRRSSFKFTRDFLPQCNAAAILFAMKIHSPFFDRIRVKPEMDRQRRRLLPTCQWPGCDREGTHRAPKGRQAEGEYFHYCLDHVKEYNQSYNYFAGMSDAAVYAYQKDALTGHRPTWKMGTRGPEEKTEGYRDPFGFAGEMGGFDRFEQPVTESRAIRTAERRALEQLGLELSATAEEIKTRFKELVKKHHPDANGGDRSTEDRLRNVIQAYNTLRQAGFC